MSAIQVQYKDYITPIPADLEKPFKLLAFALEHVEIEDPSELFDNEMTAKIVEACVMTVSVSIGTQFGESKDLRLAVQSWAALGYFEKLHAVIEAANQTEPYNAAKAMFRETDTDFPE